MQHYIDVKTLSEKTIAKNPCLQENEQEKAAKLRKAFSNDLLKRLEKVLEDY
jgi:hypothetical protein